MLPKDAPVTNHERCLDPKFQVSDSYTDLATL